MAAFAASMSAVGGAPHATVMTARPRTIARNSRTRTHDSPSSFDRRPVGPPADPGAKRSIIPPPAHFFSPIAWTSTPAGSARGLRPFRAQQTAARRDGWRPVSTANGRGRSIRSGELRCRSARHLPPPRSSPPRQIAGLRGHSAYNGASRSPPGVGNDPGRQFLQLSIGGASHGRSVHQEEPGQNSSPTPTIPWPAKPFTARTLEDSSSAR